MRTESNITKGKGDKNAEDMPDEKIGKHFGPGHHGLKCEEPPMDGGQYKKVINAKVKTASDSGYSAVLCDATEAYRPEKCLLAEREFIHIGKDVFLVVDRVKSTRSSYTKRWLLHTQNKINVAGNRYSSAEGGGRIEGISLWPENAAIILIGGKGKEFVTSGKNWELHPKYDAKYIGKLHGNWRIEIKPQKLAQYDMFVNLLRVSGRDEKTEQIAPQIKKRGGNLVVNFDYDGKHWQVTIPEKPGAMSTVKTTGS